MPTSSTARRGSSGRGQGSQNGRKADANVRHNGKPKPPMPSMSMPRLRVPGGTAGNVLWWGGLAAVAAFGVVDWPVAALIGAGTWVAERHARQSAGDHAA
ncbi:MAG TPA: hypothetical protein VLX31_17690 [Streptosporangiaceae bacterium]|nr:hypothetical protein [Streptosporangiaceae bacterium]